MCFCNSSVLFGLDIVELDSEPVESFSTSASAMLEGLYICPVLSVGRRIRCHIVQSKLEFIKLGSGLDLKIRAEPSWNILLATDKYHDMTC